MVETDHYLRFEHVTSVAETAHGVITDLHGEQLRIDVVRADIVRIKVSRGGRFDEEPTFALCVDPLAEPTPFTVTRDDHRVRVTTERLVVSLWLDPFRIDVHRTDGSVVIETAADEDGRYWAYATLNDAWTVRRRCRPEDPIYGLGEKSGRHNRRGRDLVLRNTDVLSPDDSVPYTAGYPEGDPRGDRTSVEFDPFYVSIPFLYHQSHPSGSMAGSFVDNGYPGRYELSARTEYRFAFSGGQYTEYVFAGPDMADILTAYTWLTGRAERPPVWALGYHQCRWYDYTQDELEALAARHRELDVPLDALWLDIDYMDGYRVFTWSPERFPDPAAMLARLADNGVRVITIIDPGVKHDPGYSVFDDGLAKDVFCRTEGGDVYIGQVWPGDTAFPDFATEEARTWWGELNAAHVRSGLAGIWNDMNEPATGSIPAQPMRFDGGRASHDRFHNQYALLMAMGTQTGLLASMPDRRTFILSRAGFAGIQRYAANWMGDNLSRWDHLRLSIAMGAGFGVSGQPFVGADVGGFQGDSNGELFTRWIQYGALTPFFRNHSERGSADQYVWAFGARVEELAREAVRLRYRLMPYLYSAFVRATETGEPVQRPLVLDHQYDPAVRDIDDEYLFGRDLLVAPVTEPGMTARQVYLPEGGWYEWHTDERHRGGASVVTATPMDRIPLYARAGAVVPMWPDAPATTSGYFPEVVDLHLFVPVSDGTTVSTLVEDDGLTFAARDGAYLRTRFVVTRESDVVHVVATVEGDGYPEHRRTAFRLLVHGAEHATLRVDDAEVPTGGSSTHRFTSTGEGFTAELRM